MRRISLETGVALAQLVSAFVMIFTLLYAVSEWMRVRDTTAQDLEYTLYQRLHEMDLLLAESGDLAEMILRAGSDPDSLTAPERARVLAYENAFYNIWNACFDAYNLGLITEGQYALWDKTFIANAVLRPKIGWTGNLRNYNPPFIEHIDSHVDWQ
jgi:hypothetical protein